MSVLLGTELNLHLKNLIGQRISTVVIATIDPNLLPHTAPFHYVVVVDSKHLRVAISKQHQTYENIVANGFVALEILDEGDIAVGIKGLAKVIRQSMSLDYNMAVVEIEIVEIKKDNSPYYFVSQGIRTRYKNEASLLFTRRVFQELSQMDSL